MMPLFLAWVRQSTTIMGIAAFVGITVALSSHQITLEDAKAGYTSALILMLIPQHPPALIAVQQAERVQVAADPAPPNTAVSAPAGTAPARPPIPVTTIGQTP